MDQAPNVTFTAIVSKRTIRLDAVEVPTLLVLVSQQTASAADGVLSGVRARYPDPAVIQLATVVDLRSIPRLLRKVAEGTLNGRYHERAKALEPGHDPAERIVILPDWDGKAVDALGISDLSQQAAVAVVVPSGQLVGVRQGGDLESAALELVATALE
jgi:hypothetical protein